MLLHVRWLNELLDGPDISVNDVESALTRAGFPIEGREDRGPGDAVLDVEITSNRGDCLCQVGLAREVAAQLGRTVVPPAVPSGALEARGLTLDPGGVLVEAAGSESAGDVTSVDNQTPDVCPRFTARVIRGVTVGPSPAWLVDRLDAFGQRSINNVVDASNLVLLELGQPTHAFDLNTLEGERLVVRYAHEGEVLTTLDGVKRTLKPDELVVADAVRAQSLAGVIGGLASSVTEQTTDILLEAATWDPATVRRAARRHQIATDASHRFERVVDARSIDFPAARLAALIVELARGVGGKGGTLLSGVVDAGQAIDMNHRIVALRPSRCAKILGMDLSVEEIVRCLGALEIDASEATGAQGESDARAFAIPHYRPDISREIDLIEEVGRAHGYDKTPIHDTLRVAPPSLMASEQASKIIGETLAGLGLFETVTFSFVTRDEASLFLPDEMEILCVDDARRPGTPALRPSVIPSLLACRKINQDAGAGATEGLGFFEAAAVYAQAPGDTRTIETRNLAILLDAPDAQEGVRAMRGVIETVVHALGGPRIAVEVEPARPVATAFAERDFAGVSIAGERAGYMSLLSNAAVKAHDLEVPVICAEIGVVSLLGLFPANVIVEKPAAFPVVERDLSLLVSEDIPWAKIATAIDEADLTHLKSAAFVGAYRGRQVGKGAKSVTLRLRFRAQDRTLRNEEVDPQVDRAVAALADRVGATLRA